MACLRASAPSRPDLRQRLATYNRQRQERQERRQAPVDGGIGLNAGELILGTLGSANRLETPVIGNTVNIASRLEKLTKEYQVRGGVKELL